VGTEILARQLLYHSALMAKQKAQRQHHFRVVITYNGRGNLR
jgi:hypothetical protein